MIHENAITRLAEAIVTLGRRQWPLRLTTTTSRLLDELAVLMGVERDSTDPDELVVSTGTAAGFIQATLRTTSNPTLLNAGYKHNVIPDTAEALVDIRTLPGEEDAVLAEIRELIGDDIEIEIVHRDIGLENPFEDPGGQHGEPAAAPRPGRARAAVPARQGGTDNKALQKLGITGHGFAPLQSRWAGRSWISQRCSTAWTSGCRSTRQSSARGCAPTCCSSTRSSRWAFIEAIILGLVQGLTEFLSRSPPSAHLRIVGRVPTERAGPGCDLHRESLQIGTELAVILYFRKDIARIIVK